MSKPVSAVWSAGRSTSTNHSEHCARRIADGLKVKNAILDGEIVCIGPDGRPIFNQLLYRRGCGCRNLRSLDVDCWGGVVPLPPCARTPLCGNTAVSHPLPPHDALHQHQGPDTSPPRIRESSTARHCAAPGARDERSRPSAPSRRIKGLYGLESPGTGHPRARPCDLARGHDAPADGASCWILKYR